MQHLKPIRIAIAATALAILAACGGSSDPQLAGAQEFVSRAASQAARPDRLRALAVSAAAAPSRQVTHAEIFAWAQGQFPDLFGTAPPQSFDITHEGHNFEVRAYATGNYLGIDKATRVAYGLGPFTGNVLTSFGNIQDYACLAVPSICTGGGGTGGQANQCIDPNMANPPVGFRTHLLYRYTGSITGDHTIDTVVDGQFAFEGQTATRLTSTMVTVTAIDIAGISTTATTTITSKDYQQPGTIAPYRMLGGSATTQSVTGAVTVGGVTIPGQTTNGAFKTVYTPPSEAVEFTLAVGGSVDKTETFVTTTTAPVPSGPHSTTSTANYKFEAVENVTVPAGTFSACRYRTTMEGVTTTSWFIVGKGVVAKSTTVLQNGSSTLELKAGSTYGGAPL